MGICLSRELERKLEFCEKNLVPCGTGIDTPNPTCLSSVMKSQPYVLGLSPRPQLVYSLFPSVSFTHFLCSVRYLTLSSPRHTLVSLLNLSYLSSVFLPVSSVVFTLFLVALSPFSRVWPIYNTVFMFSPHLCSLLPASPSHSYKILSQILFSVWGSIAGSSQLLTGDLSLVSIGSGFQLWGFLHQFCFQFNDPPLKNAFLWGHLLFPRQSAISDVLLSPNSHRFGLL